MAERPNVSIVINTCSLGAGAQRPSSGKRPYAERAWLLRNILIPSYVVHGIGPKELIVSGEFEPGPFHTYVPCPSRYFSCADALAQRQAGFERTSGKFIIFQHDDHWLEGFTFMSEGPDIISPSRWTRARSTVPERLNDGWAEHHINGHCCLMRREAVERVPWDSVPPVFTWDVEFTHLCFAAGLSVGWRDDARCFDLERGAEPWR